MGSMTKQQSQAWLVFLYGITIFCCTVVAVAKLHPAYIRFLFIHWIQLFAWLSSLCMIGGMYVVGKKLWWGWILNLTAMPLFLCIDLHYGLWGFVAFNAVTTSIAARNLVIWFKARNECK